MSDPARRPARLRPRGWTARLAVTVAVTVAAVGTGPATGAFAATKAKKAASGTTSSAATDSRYFIDVATEDPALSSYVNAHSNVALKALLTTGVAFCDFLQRGGGIDNAMTSVVEGANSVESSTHLPRSVRTFNSIDSAALLTLCPADQKLVPASDRTRLRQLAQALAASQPAGLP